MQTLKQVLMERDNLSEAEAEAQIQEAREAFQEYLDNGNTLSAMDICEEMFGLEPDYLDDLITWEV